MSSSRKSKPGLFTRIMNQSVTEKSTKPIDVCYVTLCFNGCVPKKTFQDYLSGYMDSHHGGIFNAKAYNTAEEAERAGLIAMQEIFDLRNDEAKIQSAIARNIFKPSSLSSLEEKIITKEDLLEGVFWICTMKGKSEEINTIIRNKDSQEEAKKHGSYGAHGFGERILSMQDNSGRHLYTRGDFLNEYLNETRVNEEKGASQPIIWDINPNRLSSQRKEERFFKRTLSSMVDGEWFIRETSVTGVLSVVQKNSKNSNGYSEIYFTLMPDQAADANGKLVQKVDQKGHGQWLWKETEASNIKPFLSAKYAQDITEIQDGEEKINVKNDLIRGQVIHLRSGGEVEDRRVKHTGIMFQLAGQSATDSLFDALKAKGYEGSPRTAPIGYQALGCKSTITLNKYNAYVPDVSSTSVNSSITEVKPLSRGPRQ